MRQSIDPAFLDTAREFVNESATTERVEPLAATASGPRRVRAIRELPGPRGLPLLGNLLQLDTGRMHTILSQWADEFGPMYRYRVANKNAVVLADPGLINEVLRNRPDGFQRGKRMQAIVRELGVDGVFNAEGAKWRRQRKLAMLALNTNHLREFFARLEVVTARLQRRWERAAAAGETVDASADLRRFTVDVTSSLAFATDLNTLETEGDVIQQHLDKIFPAIARRLFSPVPYWRWFKLRADRELDAAVTQVHELVNRLVADARRRAASDTSAESRPSNFLDAMVAAQGDEHCRVHGFRGRWQRPDHAAGGRGHDFEHAGLDDALDDRASCGSGQDAGRGGSHTRACPSTA